MYLDRIEGEWDAFKQIMARKSQELEKYMPHLKSSLEEQARAVDREVQALYDEWTQSRPMDGK